MGPISIKRISLLMQLFVFVGLIIVQCFPLFWKVTMPPVFWLKQAIMLLIWIAAFYFTLKIMLPQLLFKSRSGWFFILMIALVFFLAYLSIQVDNLLHLQEVLNQHFHVEKDQVRPEGEIIGHFWTMIITLMVIGSSIIIGVGQKLQNDALMRETLERDKIASELSFLKAQINPHFFFNILNSIYALTAENTKAKEAVYNLSHLMRYVLYDTRHNATSLLKEVAFVEDYIKLMELRLTSDVQVIFDKPRNLRDVEVAPMLFLPFIENAYKHGISSRHPSFIYIGITQTSDSLSIEIRNSLFKEQPLNKEESNGIGLINTRRRLDLMYPNCYQLETLENTKEAEYTVNLKLSLS